MSVKLYRGRGSTGTINVEPGGGILTSNTISANIFIFFVSSRKFDENNLIPSGGRLTIIYTLCTRVYSIQSDGVQVPQGGVVLHPAGPHQEPE